jgi:hypothetical protein
VSSFHSPSYRLPSVADALSLSLTLSLSLSHSLSLPHTLTHRLSLSLSLSLSPSLSFSGRTWPGCPPLQCSCPYCKCVPNGHK